MSRRRIELAEPPCLSPAEKLRVALELADEGIAMMRRRLAREHPDESEAQIDARLQAWLQEPR